MIKIKGINIIFNKKRTVWEFILTLTLNSVKYASRKFRV